MFQYYQDFQSIFTFHQSILAIPFIKWEIKEFLAYFLCWNMWLDMKVLLTLPQNHVSEIEVILLLLFVCLLVCFNVFLVCPCQETMFLFSECLDLLWTNRGISRGLQIGECLILPIFTMPELLEDDYHLGEIEWRSWAEKAYQSKSLDGLLHRVVIHLLDQYGASDWEIWNW